MYSKADAGGLFFKNQQVKCSNRQMNRKKGEMSGALSQNNAQVSF
ncbi:hypothetical protein [Shouchella shacheensis]|nr:hypothetical protein [Shouchella shacheensis]